jgi:type IV secretory pathway TrbD component
MTGVFDDVALVAGIVAAVCALFLIGLRVASGWLGDRQLGGPGQSRLFRDAARTGTVPNGAEHQVWRDLLERTVARRERPRRLSPEMTAAILGAIVGTVLLRWISMGFAVVIAVVVAVAIGLLDRRVGRREARMLAALRRMA